MNFNAIEISLFQPSDQEEAKDLILAGLVQHWGFLDPNKNPDLNDIPSTYSDGLFLVARYNGRMIGTGAYLPRESGTVEIVRMSVDTHYRRLGLGYQILTELCQRARASGFETAILETCNTWHGVINFYLRFGFKITHRDEEDTYLKMSLRDNH